MISFILPSKSEQNVYWVMEEIEKLFSGDAEIIVCNDRDGKGKGWAVREGFKHAKGDLIVFIDGDGDIHPKMVKRLFPFLEDYDVVVGVKPISGLWSRRIVTYLSRIYLAVLFNIKVDTQTGVKIFKRRILDYIDWYSNGWLFDVEILHAAKTIGANMIEVPIEANVNKGLKGKGIWNTFKESITLWLETR